MADGQITTFDDLNKSLAQYRVQKQPKPVQTTALQPPPKAPSVTTTAAPKAPATPKAVEAPKPPKEATPKVLSFDSLTKDINARRAQTGMQPVKPVEPKVIQLSPEEKGRQLTETGERALAWQQRQSERLGDFVASKMTATPEEIKKTLDNTPAWQVHLAHALFSPGTKYDETQYRRGAQAGLELEQKLVGWADKKVVEFFTDPVNVAFMVMTGGTEPLLKVGINGIFTTLMAKGAYQGFHAAYQYGKAANWDVFAHVGADGHLEARPEAAPFWDSVGGGVLGTVFAGMGLASLPHEVGIVREYGSLNDSKITGIDKPWVKMTPTEQDQALRAVKKYKEDSKLDWAAIYADAEEKVEREDREKFYQRRMAQAQRHMDALAKADATIAAGPEKRESYDLEPLPVMGEMQVPTKSKIWTPEGEREITVMKPVAAEAGNRDLAVLNPSDREYARQQARERDSRAILEQERQRRQQEYVRKAEQTKNDLERQRTALQDSIKRTAEERVAAEEAGLKIEEKRPLRFRTEEAARFGEMERQLSDQMSEVANRNMFVSPEQYLRHLRRPNRDQALSEDERDFLRMDHERKILQHYQDPANLPPVATGVGAAVPPTAKPSVPTMRDRLEGVTNADEARQVLDGADDSQLAQLMNPLNRNLRGTGVVYGRAGERPMFTDSRGELHEGSSWTPHQGVDVVATVPVHPDDLPKWAIPGMDKKFVLQVAGQGDGVFGAADYTAPQIVVGQVDPAAQRGNWDWTDWAAMESKRRDDAFMNELEAIDRQNELENASIELGQQARRAGNTPEQAEQLEKDAQETDEMAKAIIEERNREEARNQPPNFPEAAPVKELGRGRETEIALPNGRRLKAHYALVSLDDVIASHLPNRKFEPNDKYIGWNDAKTMSILQPNDYFKNVPRQDETKYRAANPDFGQIFNTSSTGDQGPPVLRRDGIVAGGNNRTMVMEMLYASGRGNEVVNAINATKDQFGITEATPPFEDSPAIVRVLDEPMESREELITLGQQLNRDQMTKRNAAEDAAATALHFTPDFMDWIAAAFDDMDDEASLRDFMTKYATQIADKYEQYDIISHTERGQFIDENKEINPAGKLKFENAVRGVVIQDPASLAVLQEPGLRAQARAIDRALPGLLRMTAKGGIWDIHDYLPGAIRHWESINDARDKLDAQIKTAKEHGQKGVSLVDVYLYPERVKGTTRGFDFAPERPKLDPITEALMRLMELKPAEMKEAFNNYSLDAEGIHAQTNLLAEPLLPWASFDKHIGSKVGVEVQESDWGRIEAKPSEKPVEAAAVPPKVEAVQPEQKFKKGSTQTDIPAESEAAKSLEAARQRISDADLAGKGKDVGGNHVTVRYGIEGDDTGGIRDYLRSQRPFDALLGKTEKFKPTEQSEGAAVIQAPIDAPELHRINEELAKHGQFMKPTFDYKPHATVAYVKPEAADRYVGMDVTEGKTFRVDSVTISYRDGSTEEIKLEGRPESLQAPPKPPLAATPEAGGLAPPPPLETPMNEESLRTMLADHPGITPAQREGMIQVWKAFAEKYQGVPFDQWIRDKWSDLKVGGEYKGQEGLQQRAGGSAVTWAYHPQKGLLTDRAGRKGHQQLLDDAGVDRMAGRAFDKMARGRAIIDPYTSSVVVTLQGDGDLTSAAERELRRALDVPDSYTVRTSHGSMYEAVSRLYQGDEKVVRGLTEFTEDGTAIMHLFEQANFSTFAHESFHIMRRYLKPGDLAVLEKHLKVKDGAWTAKAEEDAARSWERYLRDGEAPTPELKTLFAKLKAWMSAIYAKLKGTPLDIKVSDDVRKVFDRMLTGEAGPEAPERKAEPLAPPPAAPEPKQEAPAGAIRVYRGTASGKPEGSVSMGGAAVERLGTSYSESRDVAASYPPTVRKGQTRQVTAHDLALANPKKYPSMQALSNDIVKRGGPESFKAELRAAGHDGVTFSEGMATDTSKNKASTYIPFDEKQVSPVSESSTPPAKGGEQAKKPRPVSKAAREKAEAEDKRIREFFTPGNVVLHGGTYDKVLEYIPGDRSKPYPANNWQARVIESDEQGNPKPGARERVHATPPDKRDKVVKTAPVQELDKAPEPPTSQQESGGSAEPALPGFETAVAEQSEAAAAHRSEELAGEIAAPKGDISRATGEMGSKSPLFRGTEASPQNEMFAPLSPEDAKDVQESLGLPDKLFQDDSPQARDMKLRMIRDKLKMPGVSGELRRKLEAMQAQLQGEPHGGTTPETPTGAGKRSAEPIQPPPTAPEAKREVKRETAAPKKTVKIWTPHGEIEVAREEPRREAPPKADAGRGAVDVADRDQRTRVPEPLSERPQPTTRSDTEPPAGRGVRPPAAGGRGRTRPGTGEESLPDVTPTRIAPPKRERGVPIYAPEQWKSKLELFRLPENMPVPFVALDSDIARLLIFPGQKELAESALSGLKQHDAYILATATGTGKTYLSSAIISQIIRREKPKNVLVLTPSQNLVSDFKNVLLDFDVDAKTLPDGLAVPEQEGTYVTTFATANIRQGIETHPWDLVVMDEADAARRWYSSQQGAMAKKLGEHAGKVLYMSATPFHTALELGHMTKLGLWDNEGFDIWGKQFGIYRDKEGNYGGGNAPRKLVRLRQQLIDRGQFAQLDRNMEGYYPHFLLAPLSVEEKQGLRNIEQAFGIAKDYYARKGKKGLMRSLQGNMVVYMKSYLERTRLPQAIELAKRAEKEGYKAIIFSEHKTGRDELFSLLQEPDEHSDGEIKRLLPMIPDVVDELQKAFGDDIANFSGKHSTMRDEEKKAFIGNEKKHIYATYGAGGRGVSLHDTNGKHPRIAIYLGPPYSGVMLDQAIGRPWRFGTKSNVQAYFMLSNARDEVDLVIKKVAPRLESLRALVSGIDMTDPMTVAMRRLESAQDGAMAFDLGQDHTSNAGDLANTYDNVPIMNWREAPMPPATEQMNKGMRLPGETMPHPGISRLMQSEEYELPADMELPESTEAKIQNDERAEDFAQGNGASELTQGELQSIPAPERVQTAESVQTLAEGAAKDNPEAPRAAVRRQWEQGGKIIKAFNRVNETAPGKAFRGINLIWFTRGREVIRQAAKKGGMPEGLADDLALEIPRYHVEAQNITGPLWVRYDDIVKGLTPTEHDNMVAVKEGLTRKDASGKKVPVQPMNDKVSKAAAEVTQFLQEIKDKFGKEGIYLEFPDESTGRMMRLSYADKLDNPEYWPHLYDYDRKIVTEDPETRTKKTVTLRELLDGKKLGDVKMERVIESIARENEMSVAEVQDWIAKRHRDVPLIGTIERSREANLPYYRTDKFAMHTYLKGVGEVIARERIFGQDRGKLDMKLRQIPDRTRRQLVSDVFDQLLKRYRYTDETQSLLNLAGNWAVLSKMTLSSPKVLFHSHHAAHFTNMHDFLHGLFNTATNWREVHRDAKFMGAIQEQLTPEMMAELSALHGGFRGKLSTKMLNWNGFNSFYSFSRTLVTAVDRVWMDNTALPKLIKNPHNDYVRRELKNERLLSDDQIDRAITNKRWDAEDYRRSGAALSNRVMFLFDPTEVAPGWRARADSPIADSVTAVPRIATLLHSFTFKTAGILKDRLWTEAKRGNFRPWIPFLITAPMAGEAIRQINSALHGDPKDVEWWLKPENHELVDYLKRYAEDIGIQYALTEAYWLIHFLSQGRKEKAFETAAGPVWSDLIESIDMPFEVLNGKSDYAQYSAFKRWMEGTVPVTRTGFNVAEPLVGYDAAAAKKEAQKAAAHGAAETRKNHRYGAGKPL